MDLNVMNRINAEPKKRCMSSMQSFYKGKNVFITGGTGFLGKVLIEKLLRSTEVATIYMLVREKKGKDAHSRIDELLDNVIFDKLKSEEPKFKHRIVGIGGDCSLAGLGMTITDRQTLVKNVDVVFHVAATVRFDEKLHLAYAINVNGTKCVLDLCRQMENLTSLIHVSTAYANCHVDTIEEKFYDYPVKYDDLKALMEKMSEDTIETMSPQILGNWPNTYAFTKALAEALIKEHSYGIPVGIFRPAIVASSYKEPIPSWVDNFYGPTGICAGVASGLLKTLQCNDNTTANIVPVDTCVAAIIASAWDVAHQTTERNAENIRIYNYVSSVENPITWQEYHILNDFYGKKYPFLNSIGSISFHMTSNKNVNTFNKTVYHFAPAILYDTLSVISGNKPKMLKMYGKVHKFMSVIEYFCTREWHFTNNNVQRLHEKLDDLDKEIFSMSMKDVHWLEYFKTYVHGVRQYLLKESDDTLDEARTRISRYELAQMMIKYTFGFFTASFVWNNVYSFLHRVLMQDMLTG